MFNFQLLSSSCCIVWTCVYWLYSVVYRNDWHCP